MDVKLLGTSSAEGWPGLFCRCDACAEARRLGGKNFRTRSSAIIDGRLKIDLPPDILHQVVKYNVDLSCISSVLFTHQHDDHFSPSELQYRGKYFVAQPSSEPLPIYGPKELVSKLSRVGDCGCTTLAPRALEPWNTVEIEGGYQVTPILANHDPSLTCYNYIIRDSSGAGLLYASDTGWYAEETWRFLESVSLHGVVVECSKGWDRSGYSGHLSIPEVVEMRDRLLKCGSLSRGSLVTCTHFSHLCGMMHDELVTALKPFGLQAAYDGISIRIEQT